MSEGAIEAEVIGVEEFYPHTASPGEEVKLYRRLEDMYKPNAITVLNQKGEPIGYLDPSIAEEILVKMKEGIKFRCVVTGKEEDDKILVRIFELGKPEIEPAYPEEEELEELLLEEEEDEEEEELDVLNISAVPIVEIDTEDIPIPIEEIEGEEE
ncbi:TPA: hypothetical protein ENG04_10625 [Candidatus Poribacteria bacterium]|nr:hypothetical protein [Candidatus Poribacteria bacterium]HEX30524.1 hypothetical protein [Candidatus Poribacteria bacterium]